MTGKKTFVLDTNVILHDPTCIHQFDEHDIVIPLAVIKEIDHFKRGNQVINLNAREFTRTLDALSGDAIFNGGKSIGDGKGKVRIYLTKGLHKEIESAFREDTADHRVLSVAYELQEISTEVRNIILVTKDVNLRMKAKAMGVLAQDYTSDHIGNIDELYSGKELLENIDDITIQKFYQPSYEIPTQELTENSGTEIVPNKYYILKSYNSSVLAKVNDTEQIIRKVDKQPVFGIKPRNAEQTFAIDALCNNNIPLVTLTGKAGTGKTLLALASSVASRKFYRQIFIARPIVPLSNKDIGFLPGDIDNKIAPYIQPLWDNLKVIQDQFKETESNYAVIENLVKDKKIIVEPLSYIRGRSLQRIFFIVDEAQNLTPHEIKTIITRAGEGTKIVFTGDIYQIDHPYLDTMSNGLSYLIDHFKGQKLYSHINLEKGERSELAELASNLL